MALGTDSNGCCKEPSARVRAAAAMALRACNQIPAVAPAEVKERKEGPAAVEGKEAGERGLEAPMPPGPPPASTTGTKTPALIYPVSLSSHVFDGPAAPVAQAEGIATGPLGQVSVEHSGVRGIGCRCPRCLSRGAGGSARRRRRASAAGAEAPQPAPAPGEERPEGAPAAAARPRRPPWRIVRSARAPSSAAPNMIGDFLGALTVTLRSKTIPSRFRFPGGPHSRRPRQQRPIPLDRVFFNYNHFANALETFDGPALPLDRFTSRREDHWDETGP